MKEIQLTQGRVATVDDADYDALAVRSWCYSGGYAWAKINRKKQSMHRFLMDDPKGMDIDHVNGNGCDNRRCNMRLATRAENNMNRHTSNRKFPTSSKFTGVRWHKRDQRWYVALGKQHLGCFVSETEAAEAYDFAASEQYGEFAVLNFT